MKARLFGTDGVRGVAHEYPLDRATLTRLGRALAEQLSARGKPGRVLLAGDTRASTPELAAWVGGGFAAAGGEVVWGGVLPTPAVSHLVRAMGGFGSGIIVSASHNPAADNGIKLVTSEGVKWPVEDEAELESRIGEIGAEPGVVPLPAVDAGLRARYAKLVVSTLRPGALAGMRIVVDAAQGAATSVADAVLGGLGAEVSLLHASPDGSNINLGCGALHPAKLAAEVVAWGADAGVALDGDADRAVIVTSAGRILDGDDLLDLWGRVLDASERLPHRALVATVMSNLGLALSCRRLGLHLVRCPVGDREVWEAMGREQAALGGEQSGHIICAHHAVTGDGLLTAAHVIAVAHDQGRGLEELATLEHFPQVLLNVRVSRRKPIHEVPSLEAAIRAHAQRLGDDGRVFVRYSGTEPLLRIMVEAPTSREAHDTAQALVEEAVRHLGVA
ncbi:MAG: phosphoglucosamine mutase [Thermoanaerobaculaceae bacterium]